MRTISYGAKCCLDLLRWYQKTFESVYPKQVTIAAQLQRRLGRAISIRTCRRWLAELVAAGILVTVALHGPRGAEYRLVEKAVETVEIGQLAFEFADAQSDQNGSDFGSDCPSGPITESTYSKAQNPPAPPARSLSKRISTILHAARDRIRSARNPHAYRQALIAVEQRLECAEKWQRKQQKRKQEELQWAFQSRNRIQSLGLGLLSVKSF